MCYQQRRTPIYDGLPTKKKLGLLTEHKGLSQDLYNDIWKAKQAKTVQLINSMTTDHRMAHTLSELKSQDTKFMSALTQLSTLLMMLYAEG